MIFNTALAQGGGISTPGDVITVVQKVGGFAFTLVIALSVLFIIIGALSMLIAGDDETKFKKGKKMVFYAVSAVAISVLATGIVKIVQQLAKGE